MGQEGAGDGPVQEGESPSVVSQRVGGSPSREGLGQEGEGDGPVQEGESPSVVSQWVGESPSREGLAQEGWPRTRVGKDLGVTVLSTPSFKLITKLVIIGTC